MSGEQHRPVPVPPVPRPPQPTPVPHSAQGTPAPRPPQASAGADQQVLEALDQLKQLDALPVDEHAAVYDAVHRALAGALADAAGPGSAAR